jgi:hypothetical protein
MAHDDVGRFDRPPVLEQEGEIRPQRGQQRTDKAHADGQRDACHRGTLFRSLIGPKSATTDWGAGSCQTKVRRIAFEWPMADRLLGPAGRQLHVRRAYPDPSGRKQRKVLLSMQSDSPPAPSLGPKAFGS